MRPLIVFSDITVDGFMAGPDNDLDFMVEDPQLADEFTGELMRVADTIVWGRTSFAPSAVYWTTAEGDVADWLNATPKVVLSSDDTVDVSVWPNSTLAVGDGVDHVRRLKEAPGGGVVVFGGVATVRGLVTADLVDEYWLKVNPTIVGRGGSMFSDMTDRRTLTLRSARTFPSGTIAAIYSARG
ncbi:dihydrofolate reductase family protein [Kribbella shirazensis]|uniref:Dihydrofolate reductase n=1 Tax=Kribbella shirazensis TaxID=1105143 RepID=A0A7X5ZZL3_9ACTN|nr:dihydrofolate reductase family protein [Kribbella shirazensis]NIK55204.1 dihydrofolate reductase [Kribbella shirazensis]